VSTTRRQNRNEAQFGAFAGLAACVLVLALTAMAFIALDPSQQAQGRTQLEISVPAPEAVILPTFIHQN
jgi:hypothetical protein